MSDEFDLRVPELIPDDLLVLEDPRYAEETVSLATGAASGIGQVTAVALAASGRTVEGADIDENDLSQTGDLIDLGNQRCETFFKERH